MFSLQSIDSTIAYEFRSLCFAAVKAVHALIFSLSFFPDMSSEAKDACAESPWRDPPADSYEILAESAQPEVGAFVIKKFKGVEFVYLVYKH